MKTNNSILNIALVCLWALAIFPAAAAAQERTLHGHVPAAISVYHLQPIGQLADDTNVDFAIGLPLRNTDVMSNLLEQVYDPSSPNYHHYLSPDEFTAQFGPSEDDYRAIINFAKANHLTVTHEHANRMLLDLQGKASDVQKAFQVKLLKYHHPSENRDFYAPASEPSVPSVLPIENIIGLDNYRIPHTRYKFKSAQASGTAKATTGSGPAGNYMGNDFRNAYVPGSPLNGSSQTVALVEFDGYLASDIAEYNTMAGRTNIPLQNVLLDGFGGLPTGNGGEVEVSLDIEMLVSMAPALANIVVYEGNPNNFFPDDVLNKIATDNSARQISCSWGWSGGPSATTDHIFQEMALQGQTFYDAVGDSDAFTAGANSVNGVDNPFLPNQPSDSPYITQVGGTTLTMNGAGTSYASETVWNWDIRYGPAADGIGSCGGISSFYSIPSWQTNINMAASQGSTTFRNMPDVALTADDVFVVADSGTLYIGVGGTSCAAPLWAGFTALVNQEATNNDLPPIGFINPALYAIANGSNYLNCFHDITTGNNTWSQSPSLFFAVSNYDLCSGLGTPAGTNLINALAGPNVTITNFFTHLSPPAPPYGTTLPVLNGGNPNGNWELFVQDEQVLNGGMISNGWALTLTTANPLGYYADDYVYMTASATNILTNTDVTFTIGIKNYGPSTSSNVVVFDSLPSGFAFVSYTNASGTSVYVDGQNLTWNVSNLLDTVSSQMSVTLEAINQGLAVNSATVVPGTPDPNPADGTAEIYVNVLSSPSAPLLGVGAMGAGGQFHLTVSNSQFPVVIQASTNLTQWVNVYTNTPPFIFTDTVSPGYRTRFYRALAQ